MKSFLKWKTTPRAQLALLAAIVLSGLSTSSTFAATFGGTPTTPTSIVPVYTGNMNGWVQKGFYGTTGYPWPQDDTNPGALGAFGNFVAGLGQGYWHQKSVTPNGAVTFNYFDLFYDGPGLKGQLVSDWSGFEYQNLQFAGSSNHALVAFEIDTDGNLNTTEQYMRFQPIFGAQENGGGTPPAMEWNHYIVDDKNDAFLDAVNATSVSQKGFQSINDLFLPNGSKSNAAGAGSGIVLPAGAKFINVTIAGGFQGFPMIEEYVDFVQFSIGGSTTRFDFGETLLPPPPPAPEPSSLALAALGLLAFARKRHQKR